MVESLSMQAMSNRMHAAIREKAEMKSQEQRRSLMYLVADFLRQQGYFKTLTTFTEEVQLSDNYQLCDNMDLEIMFLEYCDYYKARFNKSVNICKSVDKNQSSKDLSSTRILSLKQEAVPKSKTKQKNCEQVSSAEKNSSESLKNDFSLTITPLSGKAMNPGDFNVDSSFFECERGLRPLGNLYPEGSELRQIAEAITREIVVTNLNVHWKDIFGLDDCISQLKEAVVYPTKYPEAFSGVFSPWKGILLYGAPGTGKTMLAKAVATESNCTFFNISASCLVSKWRGDSEKYIRVLFDLANHHAPSIIFIDEIDWIATSSGSCGSDHSEPARRFRAELLSRFDGLLSNDKSRVTLIAATNVPSNLDPALLRRLENHIKVNLPNDDAIERICDLYTSKRIQKRVEYKDFLESLKGRSGADLKRLCKKAWFIQMKTKWDRIHDFDWEEITSIVNFDALYSAKMELIVDTGKKNQENWAQSF